MEYFPAPLEALVEQFARLPGIGGKSAQRLAFYVLGLSEQEAQTCADAIVTADRDRMDKPRKDQRMKSVTVETFGVDYPEPSKM